MMAYESPMGPANRPGGAAGQQRPVTVLVAFVLMVAGAALAAANSIMLIVLSNRVAQDFRFNAAESGATPQDIDNIASGIQAVMVAGGIIGLALAIAVGLLAIGVFRGSNAARVISVVLLVASLCCGFGGATFVSVSSNGARFDLRDTDSQTAENLGRALGDAVPGWYGGLSAGFGFLHVLAYLAVIVLLFLPASNVYFRTASRLPPPPSLPPPSPPPPEPPQPPQRPDAPPGQTM